MSKTCLVGRIRARGLKVVAVTGFVLSTACGAGHHSLPARPGPLGTDTKIPIKDRYARARMTMLETINEARASMEVAPVALDSLATVVAQAHAEEMATGGFFSHYGGAGDAPYERFAEAGGRGHVRENIFRSSVRGNDPLVSTDPWASFEVQDAHNWLMTSKGHREAILDPRRTAVGVGFAVDSQRGSVYVVQDFVASHVEFEVSSHGWRRSVTPVEGRVSRAGVRPLLVAVHREPAMRTWVTRGSAPPSGPYADGGERGFVVPPWEIEWRPFDRTFELALGFDRGVGPGRYYGILFVATHRAVEGALGRRRVSTDDGWPGGAFVIDVF